MRFRRGKTRPNNTGVLKHAPAPKAPPTPTEKLILAVFGDTRTGLASDDSVRGSARWLLDVLDQIDADKLRKLSGGAALLKSAADLRAKVGRA